MIRYSDYHKYRMFPLDIKESHPGSILFKSFFDFLKLKLYSYKKKNYQQITIIFSNIYENCNFNEFDFKCFTITQELLNLKALK